MKPYVKPELYYESFELSQSIAACGWDMNQTSPANCTAEGDPEFGNDFFGAVLFLSANTSCDFEDIDYCYENGSGDMVRVFNS